MLGSDLDSQFEKRIQDTPLGTIPKMLIFQAFLPVAGLAQIWLGTCGRSES